MDKYKNIWLKIAENDTGDVVSVSVSYPTLKKEVNGSFFVQSPVFKGIGFSTKSLQDAEIDLQKDIDIFFKVHLERKTLKTALASLGWKKHDLSFSFPEISSVMLDRAEFREQQLQRA